jgi:hypothetical protein
MSLEGKSIKNIFIRINKIASKGSNNVIEYYKYVDDLVLRHDYGDLLRCLKHYYDFDFYNMTVNEVKSKSWKEILFLTKSIFSQKLKKLYESKRVYQTSFDIFSYDRLDTTIALSGPLSSTYKSTSFVQSISFKKENDAISVYITNPDITIIRISSATWNSEIPTNISLLQTIEVNNSKMVTEIPISKSSQYLITTEEHPYNLLNYELDLKIDGFLGQIKEIYTYADEYKYLLKNKEYARLTKTRKSFLEVLKKEQLIPVLIDDDTLSLSEDNNLYNRYVKAINFLLL